MTGLTGLTGTEVLARFIVRRDRVRIAVWVAAIVGTVVLTVASVKGLYPDQASLDATAAATEGNAAAIAFNGPAYGLNTVGGQVAFQVGAFGMVVVALMSVLMTGRLTRSEEEAGRLEMLRALPVGDRAPIAAALLAVAGMDVAVGGLVALSLLGQGLPAPGSVALGASFTLVGLVFVGVALVAAQVSENTRVVYGASGAVLGAAFALRALGDIGDGTVSWLSPIGWAQKARPYAGDRWWPLLLPAAAAVGLVVLAGALASRRDLGGGLVQPRPGPATAGAGLGRPLGLALRLQRGSVVGWGLAVLLTGMAYGSIADSIDEFVGENEALAEMLAAVGDVSLTDAYLATSFRILALIATGFAIQSGLRLRGEETSGRAEPVLATPVSRPRWAAGHLAIAAAGSVAVLAAGGLATGVTYGAVSGDLGVVPRLLGAALVHAPALWLLVGATAALVGWVPWATAAVWVALALSLVVGFLGELLGLPHGLRLLSPFEHVPQLPADRFEIVPLVVLTAAAAALTVAGLLGLQRRDLG